MPKGPLSQDSSASNIVNEPKHCWNLCHTTFIIFIDHFALNWVGKSLSSWLLINTLTTVDKYSLLNRDNLVPKIQTRIPENEKQISDFFPEFLKSRSNVERFKKKMTVKDYIFP